MTKRKAPGTTAGWSYLVDESEVGANKPYTKKLAASEAECALVAARLHLAGVQSLSAELTLSRVPLNKAVIHVEGVLKAGVTQSCVVTSAPVKSHVEDEFEAWFANPSSFTSIAKARNDRAAKAADAEIPVLEEQEDPEPIIDGKIDLGDLVTQYLSLSLDPYPRAHGAGLPEGQAEVAPPSDLLKNPFAALKDWKR